MSKLLVVIVSLAITGFTIPAASAAPDGAEIFKKRCEMCHALDTKKMGPAVNTMKPDADAMRKVVTDGRKMMPKFSDKLSAEETDAVVAYLIEQIPASQ